MSRTRQRLRAVFLDRHRDLRSGWRALLFVALAVVLTFLFLLPLQSDWPLLEQARGVAAVCGVLVASWVMTRFLNKKPLPAIGLWFHPRAVREVGTGVLWGFLLMSGMFLVLALTGAVEFQLRSGTFADLTVMISLSCVSFGLSAFFEELVFRGYVFQTLIQGITFLPATLLMSALFALAHLANPHSSVISTANVFLAGVWLSFAYMKTRSLWLPWGLHWSWNFSQTTLYGFQTSGLDFSDRRLLDQSLTSFPSWFTGGDFGPEGGILATVSIVLCLWYLLKTRRVVVPQGIVTLDSIEDVFPLQETEG